MQYITQGSRVGRLVKGIVLRVVGVVGLFVVLHFLGTAVMAAFLGSFM